MNSTNYQQTDLRYERKFTVFNQPEQQILRYIKQHPSFFKEIYHPRQINNIYLDTNQLQFYKDNQIGIANRKKIRIRWYGNLIGKAATPKLEYKIKVGLSGYKKIFELPDFEIKSSLSSHEVKEKLVSANLPTATLHELKQLQPTLINTYTRRYFLAKNGDFRLTLDTKLAYYPFNLFGKQFLRQSFENQNAVIELKYLPLKDDLANTITQYFPYRLAKKSKYVTGINFSLGVFA